MLEPLGLSSTAEVVYRTMLAHREWGVAEISGHLGLSRAETRGALDLMARLSLLDEGGGLAHPAVGLSALLTKVENAAFKRRQQIDAARVAVAVIAAEHATPLDRDSPVSYKGFSTVRARLGELSQTVTREYVAMHPNGSQDPAAKTASLALGKQMRSRGVKIRCIYEEGLHNGQLPHEQARTTSVVPMPLAIYDREVAVLPVDPADTHKGVLEIRNPGMVALAYALFEQVWMSSAPLREQQRGPEPELDQNQRELIKLLAAGHTDELVARRLGVSITTVRRAMAALMERLKARSRFQAGVQAAERGWLRRQ